MANLFITLHKTNKIGYRRTIYEYTDSFLALKLRPMRGIILFITEINVLYMLYH